MHCDQVGAVRLPVLLFILRPSGSSAAACFAIHSATKWEQCGGLCEANGVLRVLAVRVSELSKLVSIRKANAALLFIRRPSGSSASGCTGAKGKWLPQAACANIIADKEIKAMENFKRKVVLFVLAFMSFCLPLLTSLAWAQGGPRLTPEYKDSEDKGNVLDDYEWLSRAGTLDDIEDAYELNKKIFTSYVYGTERETFLMLVLKNDRDYSIIKFCLDVDLKVKDRVTSGGRTPLMYAARYCTDEKVITMILKNSSLFASNRKAHVLQQDNKGYDAFAYARNNPNFKVYLELYRYAPDSGITMSIQDDPSYAKSKSLFSDSSNEGTETSRTKPTTPPPQSPTAIASPPPPSGQAASRTPPPAKTDDNDSNEINVEEIPPSPMQYLR